MRNDHPGQHLLPAHHSERQLRRTTQSHNEISAGFEPDGKLYVLQVNTASGESAEPSLSADVSEEIGGLLVA
jgi:hypothetical protein